MGKTISIYLDEDLIEWLDETREPFGISRSEFISMALKTAKDVRTKFFDFTATLATVGDMFSALEKKRKEKEKKNQS